jgi:DNA-binding NarL/FixJ family response regulator
MIRVLVVDDHTIFRAGIARLLSDEPDIAVTAQAADGATALALVRSQPFEAVLLDINMASRSGIETLQAIRAERPRLPVIMLSMYVESQYARLALKARANAYLSKDVSPEELLLAVRHVARGGVYVTPGFAVATPEEPATDRPPHENLSPREMQVLLKIVRGVPLTAIGSQILVSVKTVATHRARILEKLGVASNAELVQYAMRHGLVD